MSLGAVWLWIIVLCVAVWILVARLAVAVFEAVPS